VGTVSDATNGQSAALFVVANASSGTFTVTFHLAAVFDFRGLGWRRYTGLDNAGTAQFISIHSTNVSGTDGIATNSVAPNAQPSIVFATTLEESGGGATPSAGTGFTTRSAFTTWDSNIGGSMTEDKRVTSTSSTNATFTPSTGTNSFLAVGAIFPEPSAGGGGGTVIRKTLLGVGN